MKNYFLLQDPTKLAHMPQRGEGIYRLLSPGSSGSPRPSAGEGPGGEGWGYAAAGPLSARFTFSCFGS
jgi:hypothetical protein